MRLIISLFLCILTFWGYGQANNKQSSTESLTEELVRATSDVNKAELLFEISKSYILKGNIEKSLEYAAKCLELSQQIKYYKGKTQALSIMGDAYAESGNFTEALRYQQAALDIYSQQQDKSGMALSYNHIGIVRCHQSNYPEAMSNFRKALALYQELEDQPKIADMHDNMTSVYIALGNYPEALHNTFTSLKINEKLKNKVGQSVSYNNLGIIYSNQKKYSASLASFEKGLQIEKENGDEAGALGTAVNIGLIHHYLGNEDSAVIIFNTALETAKKIGYPEILSSIYGNLGDVYIGQQNLDLALESFTKAFNISSEIGDIRSAAGWYSNIGRIYNLKKQPELALGYFEKALEMSNNIAAAEVSKDIYLEMAKSDSMLGNFSKAYEYYKLYSQFKDKLFNVENTEKIIGLQKDYEFSQKEDKLKMTLAAKKNETIFYLVGILSVSIIAGLLFYQRKQRKKLHARQLEIQQKEAQILLQKIEVQEKDAEVLKELDQAKSKFLTNITHEFRTPLTLIKGNMELIQNGPHLPENETYLRAIGNNSDHLLGLINKLMERSRLESGHHRIHFTKGDLVSELQQIVAMFDSATCQKSIHLNLLIDESATRLLASQQYTFSSDVLYTIVNNLLSNAIKFTPIAGNISVCLTAVGAQDNMVLLKIEDNGIGIPEQHCSNIFDIFYRVDDPAHQRYPGSGVGLSLVKELAVLHGGAITVESVEHIATTFTVSLFLGHPSTEETPTTSSPEYTLPYTAIANASDPLLEAEQDTEQPLILVVEDNREVRQFLVNCLKGTYRLIEANDGTEGFHSAKTYIPDLIISDVMMPKTDGLALATWIKENEITCHIPIILLTAKAGEKSKLEGLETGADDYLTKPFSIQELLLRVNNLIRGRRILRQKFGTALLIKPKEMELESRDKVFISQLITLIENNLANSNFGVDELAEQIFLSTSQLYRKLKAITGQGTQKFIQNIRLQNAFEMLKAKCGNISEIAFNTGFEDPVYFSKVFKKHFGFLPSEIEKQVLISP